MPCLGIGKELAKHRPHLFFLLITCNAAENGGDLAHIAANGSDKLSISGIEVVKPVFLPQGLRFLSKHLLSLPPMFCGVCVFQHLRKLQHDSCRLRGGRLQFDYSQEVNQLTSRGLLDEESGRGIHPRFPATFPDDKTVSVGTILQGPVQESCQKRVKSGQPFLIRAARPDGGGAEEWIAPQIGRASCRERVKMTVGDGAVEKKKEEQR